MLYINNMTIYFESFENEFVHGGMWDYSDAFIDKILELINSPYDHSFSSYEDLFSSLSGSSFLPLSDEVKIFYEINNRPVAVQITMTGSYSNDFNSAKRKAEDKFHINIDDFIL